MALDGTGSDTMMRRHKRIWIWLLVVLPVLLVVAFQALVLTWVIPRYAVHAIRYSLGEAVNIGDAQLKFPFTLVLHDVRVDHDWPQAGLYAKRIVLRPAWVSWRERHIYLRSVDIERRGGTLRYVDAES